MTGLPAVRHVIYLHGFASSPASSKAVRFGDELGRRGVGFSCPDLNQPAFETLTTSRMLEQVAGVLARVPAGPVALVGSSLGAFVALHAADQDTTGKIDRLVLLAPAVDFGGNRMHEFGPYRVDDWRESGTIRVFHFAWGEERDLNFSLYEDAARYDAFAVPTRLPALVFQGDHDESVDPAAVRRWAEDRDQVDLRILTDGHQLADSIDHIWEESRQFLGLTH